MSLEQLENGFAIMKVWGAYLLAATVSIITDTTFGDLDPTKDFLAVVKEGVQIAAFGVSIVYTVYKIVWGNRRAKRRQNKYRDNYENG